MRKQSVIKGGTSGACAAQARKLLSVTRATASSLDATIEFDGPREDIFIRAGKFGDTVYVRSKFAFKRFFPVLYRAGEWRCTCGDPDCMHVKRAIQVLACEKELVFN